VDVVCSSKYPYGGYWYFSSGKRARGYAGVTSIESDQQVVEYISNELLIKIKSPQHKNIKKDPKPLNTGISSLNNLNKEHKVKKFQRVTKASKKSKNPDHDIFRWYTVKLPGKSEILKESLTQSQVSSKSKKLKSILAKYKKNIDIEEVELNYIVHTTVIPDDTYADPEQDGTWSTGAWGQSYEDLWGLKKIQADQAWDTTTGLENIVVAVIDTGVDYNHPDIAANIWTNPGEIPGNGIDDDLNGKVDDVRGWDFAYSDNDPRDDHGHGTHVAGTIGAVGNNGTGVVGVNWNVTIMPVKFLGFDGSGSLNGAVAALKYAVDNDAKVLNNSWGVTGTFPIISDAVNYAHDQNVVVVAAAGNSNRDALGLSPANEPNVITVAASNFNDGKASFSNYGAKIDISAPGVEILSLRAAGTDIYLGAPNYNPGDRFVPANDPHAQYYRVNGTSMATPHVSGLAALILAIHPNFTNEEVRQVLRVSADDLGKPGFDIDFGYGRINAAKALTIDSVLQARISFPRSLPLTPNADPRIEISGTAAGFGFASYKLEYGVGLTPTIWRPIGSPSTVPIKDSLLGTWQIDSLEVGGLYIIKLVVTNNEGVTFSERVPVLIDEKWIRAISDLSLKGWEQNPAIWGNTIVWESPRNGNRDIYLYDLGTNTERQLTTDPAFQVQPAIFGDKVVWSSGGIDGAGIYLYDLGTNTERQIVSGNAGQPDIYGERIVWTDKRNGNWDIYLYDLC